MQSEKAFRNGLFILKGKKNKHIAHGLNRGLCYSCLHDFFAMETPVRNTD